MRKRQLRALAFRGEPDTFITLTVNPRWGEGKHHRARALKDAWTRVRRAACRKYGYDRIPFVAVFETTKRGEPHLHILARCKWIDQAWLSTKMRQLIDAPIVDIRRVANKRHAAWYVSKYIGKRPRTFKGTKRYWKSQDYDKRPEDEPENIHSIRSPWFMLNTTVAHLMRMALTSGFECHTEGRGILIATGSIGALYRARAGP